MSLKLERLSPALGAVVEGIDLSQPLTEQGHRELTQALLDHQVLFFRDQHLTPHQHRDFAAWFGDLHIHPIFPNIPEVPQVLVLDTDKNDLRDNAIWHTDVTFIETPPLGSVLAARELPPYGGDTLWASGSAAWRALSPQLQQLLEGLTATHDFTRSFPRSRYAKTEEAEEHYEKVRRASPPVSHPVVRTHPVTGEKTLFVNDGFTSHINELPEAESDALLKFLFAHFAKPEFSVRWRWKLGDVAFWDNRITQHYAVDDYRPAHRVMHRATILGDRPR